MRCAAHILPPAYPATALAGRVTSAAAAVTGLAAGTPVAAVGGPDGSTGALGVAAHQAGVTVDIAGLDWLAVTLGYQSAAAASRPSEPAWTRRIRVIS